MASRRDVEGHVLGRQILVIWGRKELPCEKVNAKKRNETEERKAHR